MRKTAVKHATIFFLLLIYINRGIFITPYEAKNHGNKELNSIIEWVTELITGESNDIDEDGDSHSDCNSVKTISCNFYQEFAQYLDLLGSYSKKIGRIVFPNQENLLQTGFYTQIDHPPQKV